MKFGKSYWFITVNTILAYTSLLSFQNM